MGGEIRGNVILALPTPPARRCIGWWLFARVWTCRYSILGALERVFVGQTAHGLQAIGAIWPYVDSATISAQRKE